MMIVRRTEQQGAFEMSPSTTASAPPEIFLTAAASALDNAVTTAPSDGRYETTRTGAPICHTASHRLWPRKWTSTSFTVA